MRTSHTDEAGQTSSLSSQTDRPNTPQTAAESSRAAHQLADTLLTQADFDPATVQIVKTGLPSHELDSGGLRAMFNKFASWKGLGQLFEAVSCPARVKRHNTSAWITGRIKQRDYVLARVPIDVIRSQHSIDGIAIEKTAQRAEAVLGWLIQNPEQTTINKGTLETLAGSNGALKVGCHSKSQLVTLDGVGRLEAIRQAKEAYTHQTGRTHPLSHIECYVTRLKEDEYESLYRTSSYFRDDEGVQLEKPQHDLAPYSGIPRLLVGTAMNLVKQSIEPGLERLNGEFDRRVPDGFFQEPAASNPISEPPAQR
ncbi:hypothetical protein [Limnobacter sp.]|uniref:hypothetical protein n=1 Tax=Limnobacter sp. TaxID=2003368 RepID=UPI00258E1D83|nr:hypothetical protein [Limnobacter sp.]